MNDYDFVDSLMHSDDFLEHYGVKGMRWCKKNKSCTYYEWDHIKNNRKRVYNSRSNRIRYIVNL